MTNSACDRELFLMVAAERRPLPISWAISSHREPCNCDWRPVILRFWGKKKCSGIAAGARGSQSMRGLPLLATCFCRRGHKFARPHARFSLLCPRPYKSKSSATPARPSRVLTVGFVLAAGEETAPQGASERIALDAEAYRSMLQNFRLFPLWRGQVK